MRGNENKKHADKIDATLQQKEPNQARCMLKGTTCSPQVSGCAKLGIKPIPETPHTHMEIANRVRRTDSGVFLDSTRLDTEVASYGFKSLDML
jgi:hypothetical protein